MAEAEIESLLDKKYAEIENDFAALLGSAILQPQQVYVRSISRGARALCRASGSPTRQRK